MTPAYWHERWATGQIGFHESTPNALLTAHAHRLGVEAGDRVFVPLCGKSRDVGWWLGRGLRVVGAELDASAVDALFDDLGLAPDVEEVGPLQVLRAGALVVFVGDVFDVPAERLGRVDAVYDRAALVALPDAMRARYADHLTAITDAAPQLVLCFEHGAPPEAGPPFSIDEVELRARYGDAYALERLDVRERPGGIRGTPARETAWLLQPR